MVFIMQIGKYNDASGNIRASINIDPVDPPPPPLKKLDSPHIVQTK